ncbi:META domain-containing protein [Paracoccus aerius]
MPGRRRTVGVHAAARQQLHRGAHRWHPAPAGVTLDVGESGRVTGRAPCNRYSGQLTQSGGAMTVSGTVMTRMACAEPDRMMAETRFGMALGSITAARRSADGIALIDPEGRERIGLIPNAGG